MERFYVGSLVEKIGKPFKERVSRIAYVGNQFAFRILENVKLKGD